jgi:hypothetical protein
MFNRCIPSILLACVLSVSANAGACNVKQSAAGVVTLSVGSSGCLSKTGDVAKMAAALKATIAAMPTETTGSGRNRGLASVVSRTPAQQKLYNIADMVDQGRYLSGKPHFDTYFGYSRSKR